MAMLIYAHWLDGQDERHAAKTRAEFLRREAESRTAGGKAGKRWDAYARSTDGHGEGYTGGFGRESYTTGPDWHCPKCGPGSDCGSPEHDHHTLAEYDAIARSEQGDEIVREEHLP